VIGIGAPDRGDDAIGPAVVATVAESIARHALGAHRLGADDPAVPPGTRVLNRSDPTRLVEEMAGADLVVVVDAVRTGAPAGTLLVLETGAGQPPLPVVAGSGAPGSHGLGVADALELARALRRLPDRVVVIGVEGVRFDHGAPQSEAVRAAIPVAARAVLAALGHPDHDLDVGAPPVRMPHPSAIRSPSPPA
jgi:hydrogenase maturation protease